MSNLKTKEIEEVRRKFGVSKFWHRSSIMNVAKARAYAEGEMLEDLLLDGRYPFKVLYTDNTISDEPQEDKLPVAIVLSPRYALGLRRPEDYKKFRKPYQEAIALAQDDVLGRKATAGSREFWKVLVNMNFYELKKLRLQMKHLGSQPLGNCCWIADVLAGDYAWRASFNDKALATCRKCYLNEVWSVIEL